MAGTEPVADGDRVAFIQDLGHQHRFEDEKAIITFDVSAGFCAPGTAIPRVSVLATLADIAAGSLVQQRLAPSAPLTVDLGVWRGGLGPVAQLEAMATLVRVGRTMTVAEVRFVAGGDPEGGGEPTGEALGQLSFMRSPDPAAVFRPPSDFSAQRATLSSFVEGLGATTTGPGQADLVRRGYVLQPTGTIQGGAMTLVAELAAESALGGPIADLETRFLAAVHEGPARASARVVGPGLARVAVVDAGNATRLVAVAVARRAGPDGFPPG